MNLVSKVTTILLATVAAVTPSHAAAIVGQPVAAVMLKDGSYTGGTYDAYYGVVQVVATIKGGQVVDVKAAKFPNHSGTSRSINRRALPYLLQEVVANQTSRIDLISGATLTSRAYIASLRDALKQAAR